MSHAAQWVHEIALRRAVDVGGSASRPPTTHHHNEPTAASLAAMQLDQARRDIDRLLELLRTTGCENATLRALSLMKDDIDRREQIVTERENRVWGWRLIATSRDAELSAELDSLRAREEALARREREISAREARLEQQQAALEQRSVTLREEVVAQAAELRRELRDRHHP